MSEGDKKGEIFFTASSVRYGVECRISSPCPGLKSRKEVYPENKWTKVEEGGKRARTHVLMHYNIIIYRVQTKEMNCSLMIEM